MIDAQDQEDLLRLIADYIKKDIECVAIGGTAMMLQGYKTATKDIDLVFTNETDRQIFIKAIENLGYTQKSLKIIYDEERLKSKHAPLLYSRGDERFDLFTKDVFGYEIDFTEYTQRNDYMGKKELTILTSSKEQLILLKAITNREKDYEDIETITKIEKDIDWNRIIEQAIAHRKNVPWILIDLEETMKKLKKIAFIKKELFEKIYESEKKFQKEL